MRFVAACHHRRGLTAIGLLACVVLGPVRAPAESPAQQAPPEVQIAEALARSFGHSVELASPSIVTIKMVGRQDRSGDGPGVDAVGDATGVVVDRTGGILTSWHAIEHAASVFVRLSDGREFPVHEVRADPWSDLALVRIRGAGELPVVQFGKSDELRVGDWVVAVGNSFGLGLSANPGTISALPRRIAGSELLLLQTNAVSNPGCSGGPLLNLRGEAVGICEGAYSADGGHDGIAFSIPARVAEFVAAELGKHGRVSWPDLGGLSETLSPDVARELGLPASQKGAILTQVTPGAPASKAGLRPGDVITQFAGQPVRGAEQLSQAVQHAPLDKLVQLTVLRDGRPTSYEVQLRVRPEAAPPPSVATDAEDRRSEPDNDHLCGLTVADLTTLGRSDADWARNRDGVLIQQVHPQSAAYAKGIRTGMVITHVGTRSIQTADDFEAAVQERRSEGGILLLVWPSESGGHFVVLRSKRPGQPDQGQRGPAEATFRLRQAGSD